jgi:hypothetical protein
MSRQLEQGLEDKEARRRLRLVAAVCGGLDAAVQSDGRELVGFSAKLDTGDCLLTLRSDNGTGAQVCFVGAEDLASAILKAEREAKAGTLRWRADRYRK